jgi:predicted nucleotidyltransferase
MTMLLDQLRQMNTSLNSIATQFGASRLRVFGSVARGEEKPDSDVDFLVDLPRGYDLFTQRIPLTQGLGDLLQRKVDLVPEHELNPHLRPQILAEAVAL